MRDHHLCVYRDICVSIQLLYTILFAQLSMHPLDLILKGNKLVFGQLVVIKTMSFYSRYLFLYMNCLIAYCE